MKMHLLAAPLLAVGLWSAAACAVETGQSAPAFDLPSTKGNVKLADLSGKWVYVDFWASWCGPCKQSFPFMNQLQAKYGSKGLQIVGINVDAKREDAQKFLAETPASFMLAFDDKGATPKSFAIKGMPSSVLIGPDGKVVWTHRGFNDENAKELETKIAAALAAK